MTSLLAKRPFSSSILSLCKQFSALRVTPTLIRFTHTSNTEPTPKKDSHLDYLKEQALSVRKANNLRTRCHWTKEEDQRLLDLHAKYGSKWTLIASHFVDRTPAGCKKHHEVLTNAEYFGRWEKYEVDALKKACNGRLYEEIDDWEAIQKALPRPRPLYLIKLKCRMRDPRYNSGRWTFEEADNLVKFVDKFGENWDLISSLMKTRSAQQCYERWKWQHKTPTKGRFTAEEDAKIIEGVKKYGLNFGVICQAMGSDRTPRHISQHYHNMLDPEIDRSPWTVEEEEQVYKTCLSLQHNMKKTKEVLNSRRSIRDMWNKFFMYKRRMTAKAKKEALEKIEHVQENNKD